MRHDLIKRFRQWIGWPIEAVFVYTLAGVIRLLPAQVASALGGAIAGIFGPVSSWSWRSLFNLSYAMPEMTAEERRQINRKMWVNLGRVVGEFFHIHHLIHSPRVIYEGLEHIEANKDRGGLLIGAHLANWELVGTPPMKLGLPVSAVFRPTNNPLVARLLRQRNAVYHRMYEKGRPGARGINATIRQKAFFAILVDQKLREGMMLDFFGHKASTPVAHVKIALKEKAPIYLVRVVRGNGCRFRVIVSPFEVMPGDDVASIATRINTEIENWIRQCPDQWLWPHRRWPASKGETPDMTE
ncbi:lysophospholipid acyltransferase family protein [Alphaproteobacteria bacterium LSUCC0684]